MLRSKFLTAAFSINALVAPAAFGVTMLSAAPAAADPVECFVIEVVCSRKNPTICQVSEPLPDPNCDGVPG